VSRVAAAVCTTLPAFPDSRPNCYYFVHSATKIKRLKCSNSQTEGDVLYKCRWRQKSSVVFFRV